MIKSHHNVGGLPKKMKLKLVEPLKHLFKDEVRLLGKELGLSDDLVWRQPFPGPGLAVRIIGEVTEKRLTILKKADAVLMEEIRAANYYRNSGSPLPSCCRSRASASWATSGPTKTSWPSGP